MMIIHQSRQAARHPLRNPSARTPPMLQPLLPLPPLPLPLPLPLPRDRPLPPQPQQAPMSLLHLPQLPPQLLPLQLLPLPPFLPVLPPPPPPPFPPPPSPAASRTCTPHHPHTWAYKNGHPSETLLPAVQQTRQPRQQRCAQPVCCKPASSPRCARVGVGAAKLLGQGPRVDQLVQPVQVAAEEDDARQQLGAQEGPASKQGREG